VRQEGDLYPIQPVVLVLAARALSDLVGRLTNEIRRHKVPKNLAFWVALKWVLVLTALDQQWRLVGRFSGEGDHFDLDATEE
jgi:hypothetical protein